jgi:glutathione S-transferase
MRKMILIGQYDSSYVRRVGIALTLYGIAFEQRPWSIFGDAEKIRAYNPLIRVPTLVLDDGDVLIESHSILDYLDSLVPAARRLYPSGEPDRRRAMKVTSLASGLADLAVSLFYEVRLHGQVSDTLVTRRRGQIAAALAALEADRAKVTGDYWFGNGIGHADIAVAASLRHAGEAHPGLIRFAEHPALAAHSARMEALPAFKAVSQAFIAPT